MSYTVHAGVPPDTKAETYETASEALASAAAYRKRGVINVYIVDADTKIPRDERLLRQAALRERG